jgi:predicted Fe-S protein YdhL (DUF1289 family)
MIAGAPMTPLVPSAATPDLAASRDAMAEIESPCNKVCVVDAGSGLCVGCGRTLAEIGGWIALTPDERRRVMAELPARLRALPQPFKRNIT